MLMWWAGRDHAGLNKKILLKERLKAQVLMMDTYSFSCHDQIQLFVESARMANDTSLSRHSLLEWF